MKQSMDKSPAIFGRMVSLLGIIAIGAVIGLGMTGCPMDSGSGGDGKPAKLDESSATKDQAIEALDAIIADPKTPDATKAAAESLKAELSAGGGNWESSKTDVISQINDLIDEIPSTAGGNTDPKTLIIQNIPANVFAYGQSGGNIGVFTNGTTPQQAMAMTGLVAGAYLSNEDIVISGSGPYTLTIPLYNTTGSTRWTGSGTFTVYVSLYGGGGHDYKADSVNITSGTTTVSFSSVAEVK
jgi:hypothetical protein